MQSASKCSGVHEQKKIGTHAHPRELHARLFYECNQNIVKKNWDFSHFQRHAARAEVCAPLEIPEAKSPELGDKFCAYFYLVFLGMTRFHADTKCLSHFEKTEG